MINSENKFGVYQMCDIYLPNKQQKTSTMAKQKSDLIDALIAVIFFTILFIYF